MTKEIWEDDATKDFQSRFGSPGSHVMKLGGLQVIAEDGKVVWLE